MDFDGFCAEVKFVRHLFGLNSLADKLKHLKFPVGQLFDWRSCHVGATAGKDFEDFRGHFFTDADMSVQNLSNGLRDFFSAFLLIT